MVTTQHVSPPLPSQSLPSTVCFFNFNMHPLSPEQQSNIIFMLETSKSVCYIASNWVLGSLLLGKFDLKSSLPSKKILLDTLLSSPPRTNVIWFDLSAL